MHEWLDENVLKLPHLGQRVRPADLQVEEQEQTVLTSHLHVRGNAVRRKPREVRTIRLRKRLRHGYDEVERGDHVGIAVQSVVLRRDTRHLLRRPLRREGAELAHDGLAGEPVEGDHLGAIEDRRRRSTVHLERGEQDALSAERIGAAGLGENREGHGGSGREGGGVRRARCPGESGDHEQQQGKRACRPQYLQHKSPRALPRRAEETVPQIGS